MVSIIPAERTPYDVIGRDVGNALNQNLPGAIQQGFNRGQLQNSLEEIKAIANNPNSSPLDISLAAMKAGAGIPGSERYLGALIPQLMKMAEAKKLQSAPLPGEFQGGGISTQGASPESPQTRGETQDNQFFPTNQPGQGPAGNAPQPQTNNQITPLMTRPERVKAAKELSKYLSDNGIPTTPAEALKQIDSEQDKVVENNQRVEQDRLRRIESQANYGDKAVTELKKVFPDSTPEQDAIFQKKGEEFAAQNMSEADINRALAVEAKKFKNTIANVKNQITSPRLTNQLQRQFLGTDRDFDKAAADLRSHLKPLLDMGLYDTARKLVTDLGYYPEERETVINPMSQKSQTILNGIPKTEKRYETEDLTFGQTPSLQQPYSYPDSAKQNIKDGLAELKKSDPNFSLVLARKAFEDKNYDWRIYKDVVNELLTEDFDLTDDQQVQMGILDTPPLNLLEKVLQSINLIGR